jgi:hypothetical protein
LRGTTNMDQMLNDRQLWILAVQENILHRGLEGTEIKSLPETVARPYDDTRGFLAEEWVAAHPGAKIEDIEAMLDAVGDVYDPALPKRVRYYRVQELESLMVGLIGGLFQNVIEDRARLYGNSWKGLWDQTLLHWRLGRWTRYVYEWSDFLRISALQKKPGPLAEKKYDMMDAWLRQFDFLYQAQKLLAAQTPQDVDAASVDLNRQLQQLRTFTPWRAKRTRRLFGRHPTCEDLIRKVNL